MTGRSVTRSIDDEVLGELLRGETVDAERLSAVAATLTPTARQHGVAALAAEAIDRQPWALPSLRESLRAEARQQAVLDLVREPELRRVVASLGDAGLAPLLFKGAQLAYTVYPRPDLRERLDTDVLIAASSRSRADAVLTDLGYVAVDKVSGELSITQKTYARIVNGAVVHAVDVHWQLACPRAFAEVLSHGELLAAAVPIPLLGPQARGASHLHAIVIACVHLVAHHREREELKWLYDLHLLCGALTSDDWTALRALVSQREVSAVVKDVLRRTHQAFPTPTLAWLEDSAAWPTPPERSALYLERPSRAAAVADDLRRLGWPDRMRLLREHLFPSPAYMKGMYAPASRLPLALLYLVRIARGSLVWLGARSS